MTSPARAIYLKPFFASKDVMGVLGVKFGEIFDSDTRALSGPVLRDTARLSQRYPPIARYGVFGVSTWPIGLRYRLSLF